VNWKGHWQRERMLGVGVRGYRGTEGPEALSLYRGAEGAEVRLDVSTLA